MNITILGASKGVGLEAVKLALERDNKITTLSRSPINLAVQPNLTILQGSATNREDLQKSLENADAAIVTLGTGKSMNRTTLYSDFARLLVTIQQETNLQIPFIILTGFGAGDSGTYNKFIMKLFFRFLLKDVYDDKTKMEEIITSSQVNWKIVRSGLLNNEPLTEIYRIENTLYKGINIGAISRANVADYMIKEAENPIAMKQCVSLSNK